ncbi:hypothetical protein BJY52DRAFT_1419360 [Lactarius psammicola]|nr:hypothetical protein BJY52DRAFT_1419360 [Lactarius psammicola]
MCLTTRLNERQVMAGPRSNKGDTAILKYFVVIVVMLGVVARVPPALSSPEVHGGCNSRWRGTPAHASSSGAHGGAACVIPAASPSRSGRGCTRISGRATLLSRRRLRHQNCMVVGARVTPARCILLLVNGVGELFFVSKSTLHRVKASASGTDQGSIRIFNYSETEGMTQRSPERRCGLHRCVRAISGASFVYPTTRDRERGGTGTGRTKETTTHAKYLNVCANLGDELFAALVVGWQPRV